MVVEWVPIGVEDGGGVSAEERYPIRGTTALADGDDGEGASTAGFPIDGQELGVGFYEVGVPGVLGNAEAVVALLALGRLSEDVAWRERVLVVVVGAWRGCIRYLDARTKRPAMVSDDCGVGERESEDTRQLGLCARAPCCSCAVLKYDCDASRVAAA